MTDGPFPRAFIALPDPQWLPLVEDLRKLHESERSAGPTAALSFEAPWSGCPNEILTIPVYADARLSV